MPIAITRRPIFVAIALCLGLFVGADSRLNDCGALKVPRMIFEGITLGCERIAPSNEGGGLLYWARIDLRTPSLELYVTPLDPTATALGWQYRLRGIKDVVETEHLSVAINATYFASDSPLWIRLQGDLARSLETVVANHVVSHLWEKTCLLWFDDTLTPRLGPTRPPTPEELAKAKWGIGGQLLELWDGQVSPGSGSKPNSQTAVAIDRERGLLFLAAGEFISPRSLLRLLANLGAKAGMTLDGGGSSSMAIGEGADGIRSGILLGSGRPVATYLGIRASSTRHRHTGLARARADL
jgi:hypothetical protein